MSHSTPEDQVTFRCRLVSKAYGCDSWNDFMIDGVLYSARVPFEGADALLALYDPTEELLSFPGPKLWFTSEPSWHAHFTKNPVGRKLVRELSAEDRAWYGSALPHMRVPHYTHNGSLGSSRETVRRAAAVACVSNYGGRLWFTRAHFRQRNRFILHPRVELYGKPEVWRGFSHFPKIWKRGAPANFRGAPPVAPAGPAAEGLISFYSGFNVAVCLENLAEPFYFTEKFVNAVRAGCIPVYHAHPTVKSRFLSGAKWVDPADFEWSPEKTLEHALSADVSDYQATNDTWLQSGVLDGTDSARLFTQLHRIMCNKLGIMDENIG